MICPPARPAETWTERSVRIERSAEKQTEWLVGSG